MAPRGWGRGRAVAGSGHSPLLTRDWAGIPAGCLRSPRSRSRLLPLCRLVQSPREEKGLSDVHVVFRQVGCFGTL